MSDATYEWAALLHHSRATQWALVIGTALTASVWLISWLTMADLIASAKNPVDLAIASTVAEVYWVPALLSLIATLRTAFHCYQRDKRRLLKWI